MHLKVIHTTRFIDTTIPLGSDYGNIWQQCITSLGDLIRLHSPEYVPVETPPGCAGPRRNFRDQTEKIILQVASNNLCKKLNMKNTKRPTFRFFSVVYNNIQCYYNK